MNDKNFDKIIQQYINEFEHINNDYHCEFKKWEYFKHYKDNFDIEADDFAAMFKSAIKGADFLVDNAFVCPTNGIVYFANKPETKECIRSMFKALYQDDNNDISVRQKKIEKFRDDFNTMLNEYDSGKWKFKQDFRSVLLYLTLMYPDENFLFKSTQANAFKNCIEFGNDFGSGSSFKLSVYYDMCNEIVKRISANDELVKIHKDRLTSDMFKDEKLHLLVFDIIYSAVVYGMYAGIEIKKPEKMSKAEREAYAKSQELKEQLAITQSELNLTLDAFDDLQDISIVGMSIEHKQLGNGIVTAQDGTIVTIRFESKEMKFQFPTAFTAGKLIVDDDTIKNFFTARLELETKIRKLTERVKSINHQLNK